MSRKSDEQSSRIANGDTGWLIAHKGSDELEVPHACRTRWWRLRPRSLRRAYIVGTRDPDTDDRRNDHSAGRAKKSPSINVHTL